MMSYANSLAPREAGSILFRPDRYFIDFTRLVLPLPGC
jgi:hypothetical protein